MLLLVTANVFTVDELRRALAANRTDEGIRLTWEDTGGTTQATLPPVTEMKLWRVRRTDSVPEAGRNEQALDR